MGGPLVDSYGRVATELRVSLTDRCNLRCRYCMPAEGLEWLPSEHLLTPNELARLIRVGTVSMTCWPAWPPPGGRGWRR